MTLFWMFSKVYYLGFWNYSMDLKKISDVEWEIPEMPDNHKVFKV